MSTNYSTESIVARFPYVGPAVVNGPGTYREAGEAWKARREAGEVPFDELDSGGADDWAVVALMKRDPAKVAVACERVRKYFRY